MIPREQVLAAMAHRQPEAVPYTLGMEPAVAERVDAHYGGPQWRERLTQFIVDVRAVDTDIREPFDEARERDAYGGIWRVDRRPWHLERPPLAQPSFEGYDFPPPERFFRPAWREQARQTIAENPDAFILGHLGWGLFERSWNLRGFENLLLDIVTQPQFVEETLDRLTELYLAFVEYICELPIDGILFGDDWGDQRGVIIGPKRWRRFLKPRWARIYEAVHAHDVAVLHHSCGSVVDIIPDCIEIGMDVLESVQPEARGMNPYELKRSFGDRIAFWGCLGSQSIIPFGTPEALTVEIRRLRTEMGRDGGYILAPAKPLQPETPTENAAAIVEAFAEGG